MEENKKKIIISLILSLILVIVIILLIISLIKIRKNSQNVNSILPENAGENNVIENVIENQIIEENTIYKNNIINDVNNTLNETNNMSISDPEQEVDKNTIEKSKTDKEKALEIVRKDWGEDNKVYFSYEYTENGKHNVFVRDYQTHEVCKYIVDVNNGTFEKII